MTATIDRGRLSKAAVDVRSGSHKCHRCDTS